MTRLLLVGGGHAQVEVLRRFALARPACELTLISPDAFTPYSGMLPGLIAGHYRWQDCHIDLAALCQRAGARLLATRARAIDPARHRLTCTDGSTHDFDLLTLDVGSIPAQADIPGALEHGVGVKPVEDFLRAMEQLNQQATAHTRIAVAGAGAAGVEVALALAHRLRSTGARIALLSASDRILPNGNSLARALLMRHLAKHGIGVHFGAEVACAQPGRLMLRSGADLAVDQVIWATGACAPEWLRASGLGLTMDGFVSVDTHLRSRTHPHVFAAGDVASQVHAPHPKSGVYAVRQGPVLAENLVRMLKGEPLLPYLPQRRALALLSTGPRHAVAMRGPLAWSGNWVWRWKDRIDRAFMARYAPT